MNLDANVNLNLGGLLGYEQPGGYQNNVSPFNGGFGNGSNFSPAQNQSAGGGQTDSIMQIEQQMLQIMQEMMQLLQQMEQQGGQGNQGGQGSQGNQGGSNPTGGNQYGGGSPSSGGSNSLQPASNQQFMANGTFASTGDPHLSFNGTNTAGQTMNGKVDNMGSQTDLVDANGSFAGGYQVSTQTTAPNANGITYNASATVAMNNGATSVTMGQGGNVSVMDNGQNVQLQKGQSLTLSNGSTVAEGQDGKVTVSNQNGFGGSISTQLAWNGSGVDVTGSAQDVDLGGYEVGVAQQQSGGNNNPFPLIG